MSRQLLASDCGSGAVVRSAVLAMPLTASHVSHLLLKRRCLPLIHPSMPFKPHACRRALSHYPTPSPRFLVTYRCLSMFHPSSTWTHQTACGHVGRLCQCRPLRASDSGIALVRPTVILPGSPVSAWPECQWPAASGPSSCTPHFSASRPLYLFDISIVPQ